MAMCQLQNSQKRQKTGLPNTKAMEAWLSPPNKRHCQGLTLAFINTVITSVDGHSCHEQKCCKEH